MLAFANRTEHNKNKVTVSADSSHQEYIHKLPLSIKTSQKNIKAFLLVPELLILALNTPIVKQLGFFFQQEAVLEHIRF